MFKECFLGVSYLQRALVYQELATKDLKNSQSIASLISGFTKLEITKVLSHFFFIFLMLKENIANFLMLLLQWDGS